ncbi:MAG: alpha-glucuronidase [Chitinophagaceae bacterium]|nr:alpha-glucuronidase [Chitinophagaceae bacterium]
MWKKAILWAAAALASLIATAETGYELWQRYAPPAQATIASQYRSLLAVHFRSGTPTDSVLLAELDRAFQGMLRSRPRLSPSPQSAGLIIQLFQESAVAAWWPSSVPQQCGPEGFAVHHRVVAGRSQVFIGANTSIGLLYGTFHVLRHMAAGRPLAGVATAGASAPATRWRMLNHWDNLDRSVERGYAGQSIWNWHTLPDYIDQRYIDYARANASIGINAVALTNVNANATVLTPAYLEKVKALAQVFRPYGIRIFLTARFSAPIEIGGLKTADPLDTAVQGWWQRKADEIYQRIPDFGGFLVKANSEGQPGPQNYGRHHADGANMLAKALAPHAGVVIWRAFVYSHETPEDRFKQAYQEFVPLDGRFDSNVLVQVKNGPIDFQPREPFHPLFGALPRTPTMMEFQLTQEYLGFATHLVYLGPMFTEVLGTDTHRPTAGNTVADVVSGKSFGYTQTGMAGVSNIGADLNWTGHPFAQANWYALGRLAWNPRLDAASIANEWIAQTFTQQPAAVASIRQMMMQSHEAVVNYMTPLGLHHIMGYGHHYGPAPWYDKASRADWNCTYFHRADQHGIGFDRTSTGSNALQQYAPYWQQQWASAKSTPLSLLLWFHKVGWSEGLPNGKTLWQNMALQYQQGVQQVQQMQQSWAQLRQAVDERRHQQVTQLLHIQASEAVWWRDACLSYFQTFSKQPLPAGVPAPQHPLEYYQQLRFPYAPGQAH